MPKLTRPNKSRSSSEVDFDAAEGNGETPDVELDTQQAEEEAAYAASDVRFEEAKRGDIHIAALQRMTMKELLDLARKEKVSEYTGLKKQDLIFRILKERTKMNGLMFGEGTLEVLPDGFGFLRSPDYHYLPCPDDIYVSPSQIRRFGLRKGATVAGQIRPPKENERYFALLRVEAINGEDPNILPEKVPFDDLTPLHPIEKIVLTTTPTEISTRVVDIVAPVGFGQRGLIVSPPRAGQDGPPAEDGPGGPQELSEVLCHRAAHRRATRRSDRYGTAGQGGEL